MDRDVLIVGAGLSGLTAARILGERGVSTLLVDKGYRVGCRLATRSLGPGRADHGAQFFTAREPAFQQMVDAWMLEGLAFQWSTGWSDGSLQKARPDGHPRYAILGGMNRLAAHLASKLAGEVSILTSTRVTRVNPETDTLWRVYDEEGNEYGARALILTAPLPQTLELLEESDVALKAEDLAVLAQIQYAPCLCGLFWIDGTVHLPEPGAMQMPNAAITWMADNQRKGISPEAKIVTVHAGPTWSAAHYVEHEEAILDRLRAEMMPLLASDAIVMEARLQKWRYAIPLQCHDQRTFKLDGLPTCYLGGDAFGGPRVEGAALSGLALGQALLPDLGR